MLDLTSGGRTRYVLDATDRRLAEARDNPTPDARKELVARLERTSGLTVVSLHASPEEARAHAIALARAATGRTAIVCCRGTAVEPGARVVAHGDPLQTAAALREERGAAFVLELVQVTGGVRVPPPDYADRIREHCTKLETWLILDETELGLGRTGSWYSMEREKIVPDLMPVSLSFLPGVDGGAVLARAGRNVAVEPSLASGGLSDVAASVARQALALIEDDKLVDNAKKLGKQLQKQTVAILEERRRWCMDTRGRGLVRAVTLWDDPQILIDACARRGLTIARAGEAAILLAPPITATAETLAATLQVLDSVMAET